MEFLDLITVHVVRQPKCQLWENHYKDQRTEHYQHERPDGSVDILNTDLWWGHGAHQEQVIPERRRHISNLAGDRVKNSVPDQIEPERADQRDIKRCNDDSIAVSSRKSP